MNEIAELRKNMATLLLKATVDEDYRNLCLADAQKAYFDLTGKTLPNKYIVRFCEPDSEIMNDTEQRWVCLPGFIKKTWLG